MDLSKMTKNAPKCYFYLHMSNKSRTFAASKVKRSKIAMEREMSLHSARMNLLRGVERMRTIEEIQEFQNVLSQYYAQKVEDEMERLWESGQINEQTLDEWAHAHYRTPYTYAQ